jgi:hypothetical protein
LRRGSSQMLISMTTPSKCLIPLRYQIFRNLGWVWFFIELVWILTRSLIRKFLWHLHRSLMEKLYITPSTMGCGVHNPPPQPMKRSKSPLIFFKTSQIKHWIIFEKS